MNKIISLVYKTIFITISGIGIYNMIFNINFDTLAYFTNLSNIIVFIFFIIIWYKTLKDVLNKNYIGKNTHLVQYKGIATLCITVTGLVYMILLADYSSKSNYTFQNLTMHYIIPIMTILDYFLFDEKGLLKWYHPLIWVSVSVAYLPYIFIRALILGNNTTHLKYPYFFLNIDKIGVQAVIFWCIGLIIFFTILSYLIFIFDQKNKFFTKKNPE